MKLTGEWNSTRSPLRRVDELLGLRHQLRLLFGRDDRVAAAAPATATAAAAAAARSGARGAAPAS